MTILPPSISHPHTTLIAHYPRSSNRNTRYGVRQRGLFDQRLHLALVDADRQSDGSEGPTVRSFAIYDPTQTISGHGVLKASEVLAWREDDDARISNSLKDSLSGGAWPNTWQDTEQSVRSLCEIKQKLKDGRPIRVMISTSNRDRPPTLTAPDPQTWRGPPRTILPNSS